MPLPENLVVLKEDWEADIRNYENFILTSGCSEQDIEILRLLIEEAKIKKQKLEAGS